VQILHPFAGSIQQYAEEIADPDRCRPDHCPQCQAQRSLTAHGFYRRTLVDAGFDGSIRVHGGPEAEVGQGELRQQRHRALTGPAQITARCF